MVLCATADLPGKAKLLNFMQYNGESGCSVCKQKGDVVAVGRGSRECTGSLNLQPGSESIKRALILGGKH